MKKMYSENQIENIAGGVKPEEVVDIVNDAIEQGEIEAGGLTPEQEAKLNNSLQKPSAAPAAQELVGINTSGEQNALGIGDGLMVDGDKVRSKDIYTINMTFPSTYNSGSFTLTEEERTFIGNNKPLIKLVFSDSISVLLQHAPTASYPNSYHYYGSFHTTSDNDPSYCLISSGGSRLTIQRYIPIRIVIPFDSSRDCSYNKEQSYNIIQGGTIGTIAFWVYSVSGITSGSVIDDTSLKNLIRNDAVCRINDAVCYPSSVDYENNIAKYFSVVSDGTDIQIIHYSIDRNTWVITFTTKTL